MIGRMILISSLTPLMLGTLQAANITVAGATNFPFPGKGIAALFRQTSRNATILSFGESGEPFRSDQQTVSFQLFRSAERFCPSKLGENGLAFERDFIQPDAGSCCGDRVLNPQIIRRRSRCHFSQNCRPSLDSRLLVA